MVVWVCDLTPGFCSFSSSIPGDCSLWMSPLGRRSRSSIEEKMHSVGSLPSFSCPSRLSSYIFHLVAAVICSVTPLAGSLVGNLLPRLMLRERGVRASSVKFAKTEANKPYIDTVRSFFFSLSKEAVPVWHGFPEPDVFPSVELIRILSLSRILNKTYKPHTNIPRIAPPFCYQSSHPGHDTLQT